jgi:hypothetical protein
MYRLTFPKAEGNHGLTVFDVLDPTHLETKLQNTAVPADPKLEITLKHVRYEVFMTVTVKVLFSGM